MENREKHVCREKSEKPEVISSKIMGHGNKILPGPIPADVHKKLSSHEPLSKPSSSRFVRDEGKVVNLRLEEFGRAGRARISAWPGRAVQAQNFCGPGPYGQTGPARRFTTLD